MVSKIKQIDIRVQPDVFKRYPTLRIAILKATMINNREHLQQAHHLLGEISLYIKRTFHNDNIKTHDLIAPWVIAQQEFGSRAHHYQTAVENLIAHVLQHHSICANDTATELVRYQSLQSLIPMSVDDLSKIHGPITYDLANGTERVRLLLTLAKGTLYHRDQKNILGTHLDFWKNKKTLPNAHSTSILIQIPVLAPVTTPQLRVLLRQIEDLLIEFCGGQYSSAIVSKTTPKIRL